MTRNKKPTEGARTDYFEDLQNKLAACSSVDEMKTTLPHILPYWLNGSSPTPGTIGKCQTDLLSETLLQSMGINDLYPLSVMADGNCLPRVANFLCWGTENKHVEMRVRIVHESIYNQHMYLDDDCLDGASAAGSTGTADAYAQYSDGFIPGTKLSKELTRYLLRYEITNVSKRGAYCGIWQIHAVANILCRSIISVYPGLGPPRIHFNRIIEPRAKSTDCPAYIMWTSMCNAEQKTWWQPNHFMPLVRRQPSDQNVTHTQDEDRTQYPTKGDQTVLHVAQYDVPVFNVTADPHTLPVSEDEVSSLNVPHANAPDVQVAQDDDPALTHDITVMHVAEAGGSVKQSTQALPGVVRRRAQSGRQRAKIEASSKVDNNIYNTFLSYPLLHQTKLKA